MATEITIINVDYGNTPIGTQTWTFEQKLFSATSYTLVSNTSVVNTDGTLAVPLNITGLTPGQLYYVRASPNCESPVIYFIQQVQL